MNKATIAFLTAKMKVALQAKDILYAAEIAMRLLNLDVTARTITLIYWSQS